MEKGKNVLRIGILLIIVVCGIGTMFFFQQNQTKNETLIKENALLKEKVSEKLADLNSAFETTSLTTLYCQNYIYCQENDCIQGALYTQEERKRACFSNTIDELNNDFSESFNELQKLIK